MIEPAVRSLLADTEAEIGRLVALRDFLLGYVDPAAEPAPVAPEPVDATPEHVAAPRRKESQASLACSKCSRDGFTRPNTLAMHEKHCDGVGTQRVRLTRSEVVPIRNPRSVAPLGLPPRVDQVVGQ